MAVITKQELEDAAQDAQTLEDVANGSETINGTGLVTTRLGATVKTVRKVIDDLANTDISAAAATELREKIAVSRWEIGKPSTFAVSKPATNDFTISWATFRLLDGALAVRKIRDQAETTITNLNCLFVDADEAYADPGYIVQSGLISDNYSDFVNGKKVLLLGSYYGIALGALAEYVDAELGVSAAQATADAAELTADSALENSKKARRLVSGNVITIQQDAAKVRVRTELGYYWVENNSGTFKYKIAATPATDLALGYGYVVDLDGTPNGSGELVPEYVAIASGSQVGWEAGNRIVLIARDSLGQLFGEYTVNKHVGIFDGEACFLLNSSDELPLWDNATRTLTWPDLVIHRHAGNNLATNRIKLEGGSIVVPSGGYQTVVLDLSQINSTLTPNTAVSVGQYIDPTPGWAGAQGDFIPLFAVGYGFSYPIRFPPTRGATNFPSIISEQSAYDTSEVVVIANGTDTVEIYMKGSNPLSNKYIKYPMTNTPVPSIGSDVWRWDETFEAERTGDQTFVQGLAICNAGENETAIKINGKSDFMGGTAHGDELKVWARMLIDGSEVSLATAGVYRCRRVEFMQESELFEPDTVVPQDTRVAKAYKRWEFENGEVEISQHIVWESVQTLDDAYMTMLTLLRTSGATQVSDKGYRTPLWAEEDISASGFTPVFSKAKIAKASGPSGYSAEVEILEGWDKTNREFNFSNSESYNKFYFDYTGAGYVTSIGEEFNSRARYKLDTKN